LVSLAEAKSVAEEIKADGVIECSVLKDENFQEICQRAAILAMEKKTAKKNLTCVVQYHNFLYYIAAF